MTFQDFIKAHGIKATSTLTNSNPNMDDTRDMSHHKVMLRRTDESGKRSQFSTVFSQGSGHEGKEPEAEAVLCCIASDASCAGESFEDFCANCDYDPDSRKAERTYKACRAATARLKAWLGSDLFNELLTCEE